MSKVKIEGNASGTGTFTIAAPNSNTDRTFNLPDEAGTVLTSGGAIDVDASAPADSIAIDSSGNVGIGTSSPSYSLDVAGDIRTSSGVLRVGATGGDTIDIFQVSGGGYLSQPGSRWLGFGTNNTERMRIDSSGRVLIGTTSIPSAVSSSNVGIGFDPSGYAIFCRDDANPLNICRQTTNGVLISFYKAGSLEGSISVSGSTVSYNGGHLARWSQLPDSSKDETIVKGTVMTNLDAMCEWSHPDEYWTEDDELPVDEDGNPTAAVGDLKKAAYTEDNEQLNRMAVSSVEGDTNVAGVFVNWDNDDDQFNDMNIAMTGDMVIRIAQGVTVARGDLLMSAGDGTAKPQEDDIVRSKTIAKVTSTHVSHTYDDGSYLVPCVLMAC
jgi:hypothetical protein